MSKPVKKKAVRYYSRKLIRDEFTALNLSRRRKYQLRRVKAGLCVKCNNPPAPGFELCVQHKIAVALADRKRRNCSRLNKGKWVSLAKTSGRAGLSRLENEILLRTNFEKLVKASGGLGRDATKKESAEINRLIKLRRAKARKQNGK